LKRVFIFLSILIFIIASSFLYLSLSTNSFEGTVHEVNQDGELIVYCTDAIPRFGNVNAVAYMCRVQVDDYTIIRSEENCEV
jgi:hypothetical protein